MWLRCYASDHVASRLTTHRKWEAGLGALLLGVDETILSSRCNTAAHRHRERTCTDMDVIEVGAAFPHIFDRQVIRKALILDIGVCIMEGK